MKEKKKTLPESQRVTFQLQWNPGFTEVNNKTPSNFTQISWHRIVLNRSSGTQLYIMHPG